MSVASHLSGALSKWGVAGTSIAVMDGQGGQPLGITRGESRRPNDGSGGDGRGIKMAPTIWLQQASLSKTVASAFAIEYFNAKGVNMDAPVNALFRDVSLCITSKFGRSQMSHPAPLQITTP